MIHRHVIRHMKVTFLQYLFFEYILVLLHNMQFGKSLSQSLRSYTLPILVNLWLDLEFVCFLFLSLVYSSQPTKSLFNVNIDLHVLWYLRGGYSPSAIVVEISRFGLKFRLSAACNNVFHEDLELNFTNSCSDTLKLYI